MAQVYVWGKYNLNVKYEEDHSAHAPKQGDINNFWVGKSYSFSAVSGKYTLNNALEMSRENDAAQYPYAIDGAMAETVCITRKKRTELTKQQAGFRALVSWRIEYLIHSLGKSSIQSIMVPRP